MSEKRTALVISAHAADFVWRCGEAIALHQQLGYEVTVVCLSFGERGESAKLWKQGGMTLDRVKAARRREAEDAAAELGAHDIRFLDLGDYPLELDREARFRLVDIIREVQPGWMMSHSKWNPYNTDHMYATQVALECRMIAQAWGHNPGQKVLGAPQLYLFEPHQTEQMGWKPDVFLDITPVWEKARCDRVHGGSAAPVGVLHESRPEPGQPFPPQFGRAGRRAECGIRGRIPVGLSADGG
ncbi:PIG-L deacetylase family protein [Jhaorihella thermophila]|uniref:PIG-L deacetylase family protein n=1 Tax=Jhaorihella thermophila TaxID=488547 RepID=UPI00360FDD11